jgi:membrane protein involved in colicin uptake
MLSSKDLYIELKNLHNNIPYIKNVDEKEKFINEFFKPALKKWEEAEAAAAAAEAEAAAEEAEAKAAEAEAEAAAAAEAEAEAAAEVISIPYDGGRRSRRVRQSRKVRKSRRRVRS